MEVSMERRAFQRVNRNIEAFLLCEHRGSVVTVTNSSKNGICVVSMTSFRPCSSSVIIFILATDTDIKISGKIVRVTEMNNSSTTIGIAFIKPLEINFTKIKDVSK